MTPTVLQMLGCGEFYQAASVSLTSGSTRGQIKCIWNPDHLVEENNHAHHAKRVTGSRPKRGWNGADWEEQQQKEFEKWQKDM